MARNGNTDGRTTGAPTGSEAGGTRRSGYGRALLSVLALVLVAGAVGAVAVVGWQAGTNWSNTSNAVQYFQSLATVAALLAGAGWALYVFEVGRTHAAFVEIRLEAASHADEGENHYAIVPISVRNTGRVALWDGYVKVDAFFFPADPPETRLKKGSVFGASDISRLTVFTKETRKWVPRPYPSDGRVLLSWEKVLERFEPGQEVSDALIVDLGGHPAAALRVRYVGHLRRILLPQRTVPQDGKERFFTRKTFEAWAILDPEAKPAVAAP